MRVATILISSEKCYKNIFIREAKSKLGKEMGEPIKMEG